MFALNAHMKALVVCHINLKNVLFYETAKSTAIFERIGGLGGRRLRKSRTSYVLV